MRRHPAALRPSRKIAATLSATCLLALSDDAAGIGFGQLDTFQDGTTANWQEGSTSPNPPTNVASGGPSGAGDRFLQNVSGGGGAGSRMIMFNNAQWTGNYNAAGVDRITAQMVNFGPGTLHMRVALRGGSGGTIYGSSVATELPPDGIWRSVVFDLNDTALTNIGGGDTIEQVLGSVTEMRILSAIGGPAFTGDPVTATLGVDNIMARDKAGFVFRVTNIARVEGVPRISFSTIAGRGHRVERNDSLAPGTWVPLSNATNVPGTGGILQIDDTDPGAGTRPRRFYRVVLLPP